MRSQKFTLNKLDILKGLLLAGLSSVLFFIQASLDAGTMVFDWQKIGMAAVGGMVAYLIKNFFEGEKPKTEVKN
jgi:uncharacterized membrane protein YGL010W